MLNALSSGLSRCKVYSRKMPGKVCLWMRDIHNQFHTGSKYGFMELLEDVMMIQDDWIAYRTYVQ